MAQGALRPRAGSSAKALALTILGEFVLPQGGAAWTKTLVEGLGLLGVEEKNARQALARIAEQGFVVARREGRRARWHLTPAGVDLLTAGTRRIYDFGAPSAGWDDHWLVVLCPVPEDQRAKRNQLRSRLAFVGFGFLGPSVAITPHVDREPLANAVLKDLGLVEHAVVLKAEAGELTATEDLLQRAWELDALAERYVAFLRTFETTTPEDPEATFAALTMLVHEWRRFPFVDPEIPDALLPAHWPGRVAKRVFDERHARWAPIANAHFAALERQSSSSSTVLTGSRPPEL